MRFERAARALLATVAAVLGACAGEQPSSCQVVVARAALTNASSRADYLALEPREEAAVVRVLLRFSEAPFHEMCSGVLVAERVVLSAAHCAHDLEPTDIEIAFEAGEIGSRVLARARLAGVHPTLDLMALVLDYDWEAPLDVAPLPIAAKLPTGFSRDSLVQIGGFGEDAEGVVDRRGFLVEAIDEIEPEALIVSADGLGGACFGDSGGPLLTRADDGSVRTLGLLSFGAVNCFGTDHYTRLDEIEVDLEESFAPTGTHDRLGTQGRCFDDRAVWFEKGELRASVCRGEQACGWSREAEGYRCVAASEDACAGIDDVGTCQDGNAVSCVRGRLEKNPCDACGFACERSPKTGGPVCL